MHLNVWHTCVRHMRKKDKKTNTMLPVQFTIRKKIKTKSGAIAWRKGGTQKKDGCGALVRKHVSRRGVTFRWVETGPRWRAARGDSAVGQPPSGRARFLLFGGDIWWPSP